MIGVFHTTGYYFLLDNAQTPLDMAKFYTALATDGKAATPRIPNAMER